MEIATEAWGDVPDWIEALVRACDASSQNKVAQQLGYSGGVISPVLRNTYAADLRTIERRVRAVLMPEDIYCPAIKTISTADCLTWQNRADKLTGSAPHVVLMFRACRDCARYIRPDEETDQ